MSNWFKKLAQNQNPQWSHYEANINDGLVVIQDQIAERGHNSYNAPYIQRMYDNLITNIVNDIATPENIKTFKQMLRTPAEEYGGEWVGDTIFYSHGLQFNLLKTPRTGVWPFDNRRNIIHFEVINLNEKYPDLNPHYSDMINRQTSGIYAPSNQELEEGDYEQTFKNIMKRALTTYINGNTPAAVSKVKDIYREMKGPYSININDEENKEEVFIIASQFNRVQIRKLDIKTLENRKQKDPKSQLDDTWRHIQYRVRSGMDLLALYDPYLMSILDQYISKQFNPSMIDTVILFKLPHHVFISVLEYMKSVIMSNPIDQ